MRATIFIFCAFLSVGCGEGDDNDSCDTCLDTSVDPNSNPIWYFNARVYGGYTVRWPDGNVHVEVSDSRVNQSMLLAIIVEINSLIFPSQLVLVGDGGNITIRYDSSRPRNYGYTTWYRSAFQLYKADIDMGNFDDAGYGFHNVLKHELLHSVGIFCHTSDGGVMDANVPNGTITNAIRNALIGLYGLPLGTLVYP